MTSTDEVTADVVVYTVVTGGYDVLRPGAGSATWLCFTDGSASQVSPWHLVTIPTCASLDARIRQARELKLLPHRFLPSHKVSIWVDANLELSTTPDVLAAYVGEMDIATFAYPDTYGFRDCVYQEARACIDRGKDAPEVIAAQMSRYRECGFQEHRGLAETSIVVRRNTERCRAFSEAWWCELQRGSRRDQLSFNFACWHSDVSYAVLPGSRVRNPFSLYRPHEYNVYGHSSSLHS